MENAERMCTCETVPIGELVEVVNWVAAGAIGDIGNVLVRIWDDAACKQKLYVEVAVGPRPSPCEELRGEGPADVVEAAPVIR